MLDWIFEGIITWVSSVVTDLMDAVSGMFLQDVYKRQGRYIAFIEVQYLADGKSRLIHIGQRLAKQQFLAVYSGIGNQRMKLVFKGRRRTLLCQYVNSTEADIVPCFFVFIARIPESDYYSVVF